MFKTKFNGKKIGMTALIKFHYLEIAELTENGFTYGEIFKNLEKTYKLSKHEYSGWHHTLTRVKKRREKKSNIENVQGLNDVEIDSHKVAENQSIKTTQSKVKKPSDGSTMDIMDSFIKKAQAEKEAVAAKQREREKI